MCYDILFNPVLERWNFSVPTSRNADTLMYIVGHSICLNVHDIVCYKPQHPMCRLCIACNSAYPKSSVCGFCIYLWSSAVGSRSPQDTSMYILGDFHVGYNY